jgi:hypothetical protein
MPHPLRRTAPRRARLAVVLALVLSLVLSCVAISGAPAQPPAQPPARPAAASPWVLRTREHVDLWLHGFAMLMPDTTRVPIFRRAYQDSIRARRARANVVTALDAEGERLRARLAANPRLALGAQFVALAFPSWPELKRAVDALSMTAGNPRRAADASLAEAIALLAYTFPSAADREWARLFANALQEEYDRFYHAHWLAEQRDRSAALLAADSAFRVARPRLQRYLSNTQQRAGELLLSLPLGGEGRTSAGGNRRNLVAVGFPDTPAAAAEAVYGLAHEAVGTVAASAVTDNVTPAEQRAGVGDRYTSAAQVRGGLLLLERTAPEQVAGYARYYLRVAGLTPSADPAGELAAAFPLPAAVVEALRRQIEVALEGI